MGLEYVKIPFKGTHRLKPGTHESYCGINVFKEKAFEICSNSKKKCLFCEMERRKQEAANE